MLSRVFTLTLSPREDSNSFFPPFPRSPLSETTLLGHYKSNPHPHQPPPLTRYLGAPSTFLPSLLTLRRGAINALADARTHTRAQNARAFSSRLSTPSVPGNNNTLEHGRAVARQVLTGKARNRSCAGREARDSLIRLTRGVTVISIG